MSLFSKELRILWNADRRPGRAHSTPISAKLFCKHSQVTFMPYGVVLKDERRTSNIERPTSNKKTNVQYRTFSDYFYFFSAVLILVTKIFNKSSVSPKISFSSSGFKLCFFMFSHSTFDVGRSTCPQCHWIVLVECPIVLARSQ